MSEREIVCAELGPALDDLRGEGFRVDLIYPADEPHTAVLTKAGESVRLTSRPGAPPPGGPFPPFAPEFILTRSGASPANGRAGMLYRDLIPSRLGGRYIASHIAIPDGGPVADWVHFHRIALQLIYVRRGWVRVVYEGQDEPFVMEPGDFVLQPPEIRHRVLESSRGLEVVEITAPAVHATYADHAMELPNGVTQARGLGSQRFLLHSASKTPWTSFGGGEAQETALSDATDGLAELRTIRPIGSGPIEFGAHDGELVFGFVLDGSAELEFGGTQQLSPTDSFVIPPGEHWRIANPSADFRLLHITTKRLD
ncbi:MAG TPA: cupin domain-containing protein [Sphingomicrobium sp.]|nr:cupin domain-containing protein [Sphingomicrobium sp.]